MNINWKVRAKNPLFWAGVVAAIAAPMLSGVGVEWSDMTSWATLGQTALKAIGNPVVVVAVVVSLFGILNDPTSKGMSDAASVIDPEASDAKHARQ